MSDVSQGVGWWQASDGKWYAPELHPDHSPLSDANQVGLTSAPNHASDEIAWSGVPEQPLPSSLMSDNPFGDSPTVSHFPMPETQEASEPASSPFGTLDASSDQIFGSFQSPVESQSVQPTSYPDIQYPQVATGASKSKVAAGLLAIFLGWLGIHRFYMGFTKLGVVMLLLSLLSLGALLPLVFLWGLVDGILVFANVIKRDAYGHFLK